MAKATLRQQTDGDIDAEAERMTSLNEAEGGDLYRAIDEARSTTGAEVILTRTMPADKAGFCDKIPVAEFDLSMLKAKYGAGTYRVRFNGPSGFLPGGGTIKIAPTPEKERGPAGDFGGILEIMERRDAERRNSFNDWLKLCIPIVGGIVTAMVSRQPSNDIAGLVTALKPPPGPTLADLSGALVNMKTLSGGDAKESQVDTILKVFEAAQNLMGDKDGGGTKDGSNWVDVIRDLIKVAPDAIKPMLEARMAQMQPVAVQAQVVKPAAIAPNAPAPTTSQAAPSTATTSTASAATNGESDMRAIWEPIARVHLGKVADWAEKDREPAVYAAVFMDDLPDVSAFLTLDEVLQHLENPQWFDIICVLEPRLSSHREYCDEFRQEVIALVKQLKEEALEENPPTGE